MKVSKQVLTGLIGVGLEDIDKELGFVHLPLVTQDCT